MGTARGSREVADAIKDIELERIRGPGDAASVKLGSFWEDQPVVIHLLRRFGCQLCRGQAVEMAKMLPQLEANNVRVVGIGLEKLGMEEFEEKKFWKSELYIDNGKKIHNALALTKVGWVGTFMMIVANKSVKEAAAKTKDTPGNFQGDGRQLGATFVMAKGGDLLLDHRQKDFGDQPTNAEILEALGLDSGSQAK
jgi:prostamide/prostaglandin F2alpha synthase